MLWALILRSARADRPKMEYPLVSVIITAYNYAHTLAQAIDSSLQEDYPNLEVIVMDNASTDETQSVLSSYVSEPRVRTWRNDSTLHSVDNHNAGLEHARGSYIVYLSADDQLVAGYIKRAYDYLRDNPTIDVVYSGIYTMNMEGRFLDRRMNLGEPPCGYSAGRNELAGLFAYGCYIVHGTILTHRRNYERFNGFSKEFTATDYDLYIRWASAGLKMARLAGCGMMYRIHTGGISSVENYTHTGKELLDFCGFIKKYLTPGTIPQIRGYETQILAALQGRYASAIDHAPADGDQLNREFDECSSLIERYRHSNSLEPFEPKIVVLVIAQGPLHEIHRTLISLLEQQYDHWEALVLEQPNTTLAGFCQHIDPRGRIKACNWERPLSPGRSLNLALTLSSANCCTFLETGTIFPPDHLQNMVTLFESSEYLSLVSQTRSVIVDSETGSRAEHQGFLSPGHFSQLEMYPIIPLDAIAFKREVYDRVYRFQESLDFLPEWDFLLRIAGIGKMGIMNSTITRYSIVNQAWPGLASGGYIPVAQALYQQIPAKSAAIAAQRSQYLQDLQHLQQLGSRATATLNDLMQTVQLFRGVPAQRVTERELLCR